MAAHTLTYTAPALDLIATVATGDTIVNSTLGALEVVEGSTTGGATSAGTAVTVIAPGATYTVLAAQNGKDLYSVNTRNVTLGTVPTLTVTTV